MYSTEARRKTTFYKTLFCVPEYHGSSRLFFLLVPSPLWGEDQDEGRIVESPAGIIWKVDCGLPRPRGGPISLCAQRNRRKAWPKRATLRGPCIRASLHVKTRLPDGAKYPSHPRLWDPRVPTRYPYRVGLVQSPCLRPFGRSPKALRWPLSAIPGLRGIRASCAALGCAIRGQTRLIPPLLVVKFLG
jgi:hypothetical protein